MNPLNPINDIWGSWSWNDSDDEVIANNNVTGNPVYAPGQPPEAKPDNEIKDWPSVPFGD